uniref:Isoleucine--tRNA ligase, cytoplasmic n=1 Tax=Ciona savignyi TaxID=51511 RepID=H2Z861_CIOSA
MVEPVPEKFDFPKEEEKILELWNELDAFQTSLKQSKGKPRYAFYDGPPFATGLPHYGHILAGTIKDIVTRYAHQSGFHVERRFGWDCHGLPVEYEIDKTLGIKGPEDVMKLGIAEYNRQCRSIVMRYSSEWEMIVKRLGRWIDFKKDYKTLYPWFMESVWWVFKQLFDKGFVYRGFKVMPFSTGCHTPLSNFEANQNYKDVNDPAVIISFPLVDDPNVKLIAWTTTPWTLPSNLALCVNPKMTYVKVKDKASGSIYILMEARLVALYKSDTEYEVIEKMQGTALFGLKYIPLFDYFDQMKEDAFKVLTDGYVTDDSGTGVVHQAPFFGADDYRICLANKVFKKDGLPICPVDSSGKFTDEVRDFAGMYVKDADKHICKLLKQRDRLVHQSTTKHNYPFCWRSDTPLIYKAVPSWFIRVENITEKLLENNSQCYWVPEFVKEKRFANWLRDAHDWAVSRNRYWGTPIPIWVSEDLEEVVCVGSIDELEELSGVRVTDIHRENVDDITIPSRLGKGVLRRIPEVFDCWFESGAMPYAQLHYPFENKKEFEDGFPADFIAEGIDQTRGWFYTLLVLSTSLFGKPPFKNLIVNGLVLARYLMGTKMSKRKKNYPDPIEIITQYGADALRLYLINSPVVRAENLRFQANGVKDVLKDVFLPWYNAYRFLIQNIIRLEKEEGIVFSYKDEDLGSSSNIMDQWILSSMQSLVLFVKQEMQGYRLYTVVPKLVKFVDLLTNWYVRSNRRRLKGEGGLDDCLKALQTLFNVILTITKTMAPFTPFLTEHMYQNLKRIVPGLKSVDSVHYNMMSQPVESLISVKIEKAVSRMQSVIELARVIRDRKTMPTKYPLPEVVIIHKDPEYLDDVVSLSRYVTEELNVRSVTTSSDKDKYGVSLRAEPDHVVLGKRLKGICDFKSVMSGIRQLTNDQVEQYLSSGSIQVLGHDLVAGDLRVIFQFEKENSKYEAHSDNDVLILLDVTPDQSMLDEGVAREVINRIQKLRKKAKLVPTDDVTVFYNAMGSDKYLCNVIMAHGEYISNNIKSPLKPYPVPVCDIIIKESTQLKGSELEITLVKGHEHVTNGPLCRFLNIQLRSNGLLTGNVASVLLENPSKCATMRTATDLKNFVSKLYLLNGTRVALSVLYNGAETLLPAHFDPMTLSGCTLLVDIGSNLYNSNTASVLSEIACPYINLHLAKGDSCGEKTGVVLLENPVQSNHITLEQLHEQAKVLFGQRGRTLKIYTNQDLTTELNSV